MRETTITCDRCGVKCGEYWPNGKYRATQNPDHGKPGIDMGHFFITDLCPECNEALQRFMRMEDDADD